LNAGAGSALEVLLGEAAAEVGAELGSAATGATEFRRGRLVFAAVAGNAAEFRLDEEIAEAVLRTPDTQTSSRGPEWVRLAVSEPTPMDLDRAKAWFLSAWRNAAG
jgi:hypothetical protein